MKPKPLKKIKVKTQKAWAIVDRTTNTILRYERDGSLAIDYAKTPQKHLHESFISVPCTITYPI